MTTHADYKEADLGATETTETNLGTITVSAKGKRIIGVWGTIAIETSTAGESTVGSFRLGSSDVDLAPAKFPATIIFGAAGTLASNASVARPNIIPVNIPVNGKEVIDCYATLNQAQTGDCHAQVGIIYE